MNRKTFITSISLLASSALFRGTSLFAQEQTKLSLYKRLTKTDMRNLSAERMEVLNEIQAIVNKLPNKDWGFFCQTNHPTPARANFYRKKYEAIRLLEEAFAQQKKNILNSKAISGEVLLFHIYNMGYVVKTPTATFGIDVRHPQARELADTLDFLLITHHHADHFDYPLIIEMQKRGKPVVSNFLNNDFNTWNKSEFTFGEIAIKTKPCDHNKNLPKFVITYEIDCGKTTNNCILYHTGDAWDYKELTPTQTPDVFIPHLEIVDVHKAAEQFKPKAILMSHILELGHPPKGSRWKISFGLRRCKESPCKNAFLPLWGETYKVVKV